MAKYDRDGEIPEETRAYLDRLKDRVDFLVYWGLLFGVDGENTTHKIIIKSVKILFCWWRLKIALHHTIILQLPRSIEAAGLAGKFGQ